ncbi:MAG: tryptophan synthase subunit alpha [Crocinitomicaceae bacterium]|nr:tryptophan synthase subunit alpha [Crocinitomicaceae bacterium]
MKLKTTHPLLSIFLTAGYPQLNDLPRQLALLEKYGVDFVEVGIPFSDPLADGPVIQESSTIALKNGMQLSLIFQQLKAVNTSVPLVLMGYLNPILQFGMDRFLAEANHVGVKHVVLPDLSIEIYERSYKEIFDHYGVTPCFLVTPKTSDDRIRKAARLSEKGFVYLVSTNATTGSQHLTTLNLQERYREVKSLCGATPVIMGFGIRDKATFEAATVDVDGAIIGSAFIQALGSGKEEEFLAQLKSPK